jgi:hypothetical protein
MQINICMDIDKLQDAVHTYMHAEPLKEQVRILSSTLNVPISITPTGYYMHRAALWSEQRMQEFCKSYIDWMRVDEAERLYSHLNLDIL